MDFSNIEHIIYGFLSGLTEILPVSARAHSMLMLKILGTEKKAGLSDLLIHMGILAALYMSSQIPLVKMSRARKLARIPKKKRKRPLDIVSLMDSRFLFTMLIPIIPLILVYERINAISFGLLAVSGLLFLNGLILYIPQFLPSSNRDARNLSRIEGLLMGLGGTLSVLPGLSGVAAATSIGSVCGVERKYALNMTILFNIVYLLGLVVHDIFVLFSVGFGVLTLSTVLIYILAAGAAFISTMLAIRIMRSLAAGVGYSFFAYYCWGIALFAFILNLIA